MKQKDYESIEACNNVSFPLFNNQIDRIKYDLFKRAQVKEWAPDPIAVKLGFTCPDCNGYRNLRVLTGEKRLVSH